MSRKPQGHSPSRGRLSASSGIAACVAGLALAALFLAGCVISDPASDVSNTAATLHGRVLPGGKPTTYWFQYGETTSYGSDTPRRDAGSGNGSQGVSEPVAGLSPDTLYHFRICEENQDGSGCASDRSFQTHGTGILPGFQETSPLSGLTDPTSFRFSPDGRIFVAEKSGLIKVFDDLADPTPTIFADLRTEVHNTWDRGLLSLALDPAFPAKPFVYVAYTHDAAIGGSAPRWGQPGATYDGCPNPPGATSDGCVVSGRVSRLHADGDQMVGGEQVLLEDWCQQFPSHSIGDIRFGADGALYVSGGDGASFNFVDYGQQGTPRNPCGDPPAGVGGTQTPPGAEGGALRSQDLRTSADPTALNGAVVRIDPDTGEALPDNPRAASSDPNARRIVAHGLRNPYRFAIRPGTNEVWIGDVGWGDWEEINRIPDPTAGVSNFGWPCYEGRGRQPGYDAADLSLCEGLYGAGGATEPYFTYAHAGNVVTGETCPSGGSSISGIAFTPPGSALPAEFDGALFFSDYSRDCIWVMERNGGALPSSSQIKVLRAGASNPVDIEFGPGGDLFYADFNGGAIKRLHYTSGNQAPRAVASATPTSGATPLSVSFDGSASSDPDPGDTLSYAWDLDGDGAYDDATGAQAGFVYQSAGSYAARLKVTDNHGASATDTVAITAGNTPPTATITAPAPSFTWAVGDPINFGGGATDPQDGILPASSLSWSVVLYHCPSNCHTHPLQGFDGVASGSLAAPDHEYPSYLELRLTATDSGGLTDTRSVRLDPKTVTLAFASNPGGLSLAVNAASSTTPFSRTVIQGSSNTISAPTPQPLGPDTYDFSSWSDGASATHSVQAVAPTTYTATYARR